MLFLSLFRFATILLIMKKHQQRGKTLQIIFKKIFVSLHHNLFHYKCKYILYVECDLQK